jgi:predicted nucleic acid-binding protein
VKVIDSSALIKYITKETGWQEVEQHIKEECVTLDLAIKEAGSALVKKTIKGEVSKRTASEILSRVQRIVRIVPQKEHLPKALEVSIKYKLSFYDALFIALSSNIGASLLTSDEKQARVSKENGVTTLII